MNKRELTEADIRTKFITPALVGPEGGKWNVMTQIREEIYFTRGRVIVRGKTVRRGEAKKADYILSYKPGIPIAVIEAKDNNHGVGAGMQQALEYAEILDVPFAYSSNGDAFLEHDRTGTGGTVEREIPLEEFPSPEDLWERYRAATGCTAAQALVTTQDYYDDGSGKAPRYYQIVAINRTVEAIARGENRILLVMATGTGKPSRAFYFGDRNLYDQEARRFDQEEKARILNTDRFPRNLTRFEELKRSCQRGFVIPFVGAGMSKSAGCPEWKEYLLGLCDDAHLDAAAMRERLEAAGDYEGVMNDLVQALGENRFNLDFERDFKTPEDITGAVTLLPRLFDNAAVTTNFDRLLETVYANEGRPFVEKVTGRGMANAFFRAIPAGDRYLLKLHGNLDNATERVLNKVEYDIAYGNDGNIHFDCPLPKLLKRLFTSYSFMFLGCSLAADRTIQTFMRVAQLEGQDNLPHHYALLSCPADNDKRVAIDRRLADAHITPLWYPEGEHEHVEQIFELLLD